MSKLPHHDGPFQFRELTVSADRTIVALACLLFRILEKVLGKAVTQFRLPAALSD